MTVLLSVLGLLAVAVLTFGTAVAVGSEFSLTALERSQVDADVAARGDRQARIVQRAHREPVLPAVGQPARHHGHHAGHRLHRRARRSPHCSCPASPRSASPRARRPPPPPCSPWYSPRRCRWCSASSCPKNLAIADPLRTARAVVWLQSGFAHAFRRLISALNAMANAIVRTARRGAHRGAALGPLARRARAPSCAPAPSAAPSTPPPRHCWTGRCASPTASPKTS